MKEASVVLVAACLLSACAATSIAEGVAVRRERVLALANEAASVPSLAQALQDKEALVRRAAVRKLADVGAPAREALLAALDNNDVVVRHAALMALANAPTAADLSMFERTLADKSPLVRKTSVRLLVAVQPRSQPVLALLRRAANDPDGEVKAIAASALPSGVVPFEKQFHKEVVLLRDRPDMADHTDRIVVAQRIPLPRQGWKFRKDLGVTGHRDNWPDPAFDDSKWELIETAKHWEAGYTGVGWYRGWIELPARPEHAAVELAFEAVDENAWVWVNGAYVGQQNMGLSGWDKAFRLDVTREIRWGARNCVVVRVNNTKGAGGIWKPVALEVLTLK